MNLQHRTRLLSQLGEYMTSGDARWQAAKERAGYENGWFIPEFVNRAVDNITSAFLNEELLTGWARDAGMDGRPPKTVGIIMAGNIPLVGFHDFLAVFVSGHRQVIKLSSKDQVLMQHLVEVLTGFDPGVSEWVKFADMLKGCDAYIATGSNNTSRYFEYYFGKYPCIIRRNKTSVAVLTGRETGEELEKLADDIYLYFGLGCRNVTKIYVPEGYDFVPLLNAGKKYSPLADHHKYKNNYDYNLALHILNNKFYMTNGALLLVEETPVFSPVSQLNYEYYQANEQLQAKLEAVKEDIQCITGHGYIPFGGAQCPGLNDWADGVNTLEFLAGL